MKENKQGHCVRGKILHTLIRGFLELRRQTPLL